MFDTVSALEAATVAWSEALGAAFVGTDPETLRRFERATFATSQRVLAVLQPGSAEEVAACLRVANQFCVPVYPISRGRNWGLGSRVPVTDAAILDLGRMDRILEMDEAHGTLTLEPGVSFAQAHEYLVSRRSRWFVPVIGGPAAASVLGNALERGDVTAPLGDGPQRITGLQVVLPQGEIIETGYERFGGSALSTLSASPAGPGIDGLFLQGNFGVVTRATVWLSAHPQSLQLICASVADGGLAAFIDALRTLVVQIGGQGIFTLWTGAKLKARRSQHVSDERWFYTIALYAPSRNMALAQRELAIQALTPVSGKMQILDQGTCPDLRERAGLFLGVPNDENVRSLYAARPGPPPADSFDPDGHRCGALWICPEVPFDGIALNNAAQICIDKLTACGYPPILAVHVHSQRVLRMFVSIFYDRDRPDEDERALRCHDELLALLASTGCYPFRLGIQSMPFIQGAPEAFWNVTAAIKAALDPREILAPGRYSR